jgi:hypothetical protein
LVMPLTSSFTLHIIPSCLPSFFNLQLSFFHFCRWFHSK